MRNLVLIATTLILTAMAQAQTEAAPPVATPPPAAGHEAHKEMKQKMRAEHKEMKEKMKAAHAEMKEKIEAACATDAGTAGCSQEMGKGLMKCLHAYKEKNKDFQVSDSCKAAAHEGKEMREHRKMVRKSWKDKKEAAKEETK